MNSEHVSRYSTVGAPELRQQQSKCVVDAYGCIVFGTKIPQKKKLPSEL